MTPPTEEQLLALRVQITRHRELLDEYLLEQRQSPRTPKGPKLRYEQAALLVLLVKSGYDARLGGQVGGKVIAYGVHSEYLAAYDEGLFNKETCSWSIDGVPNWALLELYTSL